MTCASVRLALGAYVIGSLDAGERAEADAHLLSCAACRDALAALAGLPGLLGRLSAEEVAAGPPVAEPALLDRVLLVMRRRRRMRHRLLAVAAALVVLTGAAGALLVTRQPAGPHPVVASSGPVSGAVTVGSKKWGTELRLKVSGVSPGERCSLVAVSRDGRREVAASWEITYRGPARITGATSIFPRDLSALAIETTDGRTLLEIPVAASAVPAAGHP